MHVVERFKRTGADTINYEGTIEDSKVLTKPFRISLPLSRVTAKNASYSSTNVTRSNKDPQLRCAINPTRTGPG